MTTTDLNQLQIQFNKAEQEMKRLGEELKRAMEKEKELGTWVPEHGDTVFVASSTGDVFEQTWYKGTTTANGMFSMASVFKTRAEAKEFAAKRKEYVAVIRELKKLAGWFKPNWKDYGTQKFTLIRNHEKGLWVEVDFYYFQHSSFPVFKTSQDAQAAIKVLGSRLDILLWDGVS